MTHTQHTCTHIHIHTQNTCAHAFTHTHTHTHVLLHVVPPDMLVESVRQWLAEDRNGCCFHHVIFSCSTFFSDTETQLERYFPHRQLDPSDTQRDSGQSDSMSDDGSCSPEGIQEAPVAKDKPLAARLTSTVEPQDQGNQQFDIMPGALQSDV